MNEGFSSCFSICNIVFYLLQDLDFFKRDKLSSGPKENVYNLYIP